MDWIALCIICMNVVVLQARHDLNINKLIEIIKRRNSMYGKGPILGVPRYPEDLPEAEAILPGHTLIRPSVGMLKSAIKFPLRDLGGSLVYGNKDNIGISNDQNERVLYTNFRKSSKILDELVQVVQSSKGARPPLIVLIRAPFNGPKRNFEPETLGYSGEENNAREVLDESDPAVNSFEENSNEIDFRRRHKSKSAYRKRSYEKVESSSSEESASSSLEYDKNPGNPYTLLKGKYKKNWAWNHFMDGDHMNINPYAPEYKNMAGPSGPELFFGRKWWYFNQDDYKPMR